MAHRCDKVWRGLAFALLAYPWTRWRQHRVLERLQRVRGYDLRI